MSLEVGEAKAGVMLGARAAVRLKKKEVGRGEGSREAGFAFSGS